MWKKTCQNVEKILKGNMDLIPSLSVKIHIMEEIFCLRCKGKTLLGIVNKLWKQKVCWKYPAMFCLYTKQVNFPAHILNFHWRSMGSNADNFLKSFSLLKKPCSYITYYNVDVPCKVALMNLGPPAGRWLLSKINEEPVWLKFAFIKISFPKIPCL